MPSRKQLNLKQGVSLRVPQMGVDQLCQFGSRSFSPPLAMKLLFIFSLRTSQSSSSADSFSGALQHSAQRLVNIPGPEHLREFLKELLCLGEHRDTTDRPVKAMRNPHIHLARLVISLGDEGFRSLASSVRLRSCPPGQSLRPSC